MEFEIKYNSIARRWLFNVYMPILLSVTIIAIFLGIFIRSYYIEKVKDIAEEYTTGFSLLAATDPAYFAAGAREYCEQFEYKDRLEIMVINNSGEVFVSTSGFERNDLSMPDYHIALKSDSGKAAWIGRSSAGEPVLCGTEILKDYGSGSNGAVRYAVSLSACYKRIGATVGFIVLVALGILLLSAVSGLYFIKSIAIPIKQVSAAARKIASGDYKEELKANKADEIGELCDSINYMESELKNAEEMKNDFISSVSHELRTPLTAIRGWAETAKMSLGYDEQLVSRGLDVVLSESERLGSLVEELLDFSRMQNGRMSFNMRPFNVSKILSEAVDMYVELANQRKIEITATPFNASVTVNGDSNRIKQVFVNIIDNAVKYTNEMGQVLISMLEEDGCVRITVRDTGVGIPAVDLDRVKEKFYKANKEVRGSGIGLAVADEIIKQHQGLLFIESTENVGTTVTIVLPLYVEPTEYEASVNDEPTVDLTQIVNEAEENQEPAFENEEQILEEGQNSNDQE